jgi:transposase InsO family protein
MSPQTNGICERFHKTILQAFYQITCRKKLYGDLETLQKDLDEWLMSFNNERDSSGQGLQWQNANRNFTQWKTDLGRKKSEPNLT